MEFQLIKRCLTFLALFVWCQTVIRCTDSNVSHNHYERINEKQKIHTETFAAFHIYMKQNLPLRRKKLKIIKNKLHLSIERKRTSIAKEFSIEWIVRCIHYNDYYGLKNSMWIKSSLLIMPFRSLPFAHAIPCRGICFSCFMVPIHDFALQCMRLS